MMLNFVVLVNDFCVRNKLRAVWRIFRIFLEDFCVREKKNCIWVMRERKRLAGSHEDMQENKPTVSYFFHNETQALNDNVLVLPFPLWIINILFYWHLFDKACEWLMEVSDYLMENRWRTNFSMVSNKLGWHLFLEIRFWLS